MDWVLDFYRRQNEWAGVYLGGVVAHHRENAAAVRRISGIETGRVLELGAGGGQNAAALADLGFSVVAIELVPSCLECCAELATERSDMIVVAGDFFDVEVAGPFDIVCSFDGFGIGTDEDQRRLLRRVEEWLSPRGVALIEVYAPDFWSRMAGREMDLGRIRRRYGFDPKERRMLDRWWPAEDERQAVTQSLRCYLPEEFAILARSAGLTVEEVESRGTLDLETGQFVADAVVQDAMQYLARLVRHRPTRPKETLED